MQINIQHRILERVREGLRFVPVPDQIEHSERFQRFSVCVKQCLIVHRASAIVFSRIIRIINRSITGSPAGTVFLPDRMIVLPGILSDCNPCSFPVNNTDSVLCPVGNRIDHIAYRIRLILHSERIRLRISTAFPDCISGKVRVLIRKSIGCFHHHHFFAIGVSNFGKNG